MDIKTIHKIIHKCIKDWRAGLKGPYSWVDDGLSSYDFSYDVHIARVSAWNRSGRAEPKDVFFEKWATEENIRAAVQASAKSRYY